SPFWPIEARRQTRSSTVPSHRWTAGVVGPRLSAAANRPRTSTERPTVSTPTVSTERAEPSAEWLGGGGVRAAGSLTTPWGDVESRVRTGVSSAPSLYCGLTL